MHSGARHPSEPARLLAVGANEDWSCSSRRARPKSDTSIRREPSLSWETSTFLVVVSCAQLDGAMYSLRFDVAVNNLHIVQMPQPARHLSQRLFTIQHARERNVLVWTIDQIRQTRLAQVECNVEKVVAPLLAIVSDDVGMVV